MTLLVRRICLVGSFDTVAWIRYSTKPLGTYQLSHSPHGCLHYAEALEFPVGRWLNFCCWIKPSRSEEHTSELQSLMRISYAVFCLKKKKNKCNTTYINITSKRPRIHDSKISVQTTSHTRE